MSWNIKFMKTMFLQLQETEIKLQIQKKINTFKYNRLIQEKNWTLEVTFDSFGIFKTIFKCS